MPQVGLQGGGSRLISSDLFIQNGCDTKSMTVPSREDTPLDDTTAKVLRKLTAVLESVKLDRKLVLELLTLAGITALALLLRWTASLQNGVSVFPDDDSYWHYHLEEQIVQFGHRLNPDLQAWLPLGRPETHPPLFHYAVAYTYLFLHYIGSGVSLFTVAYYSNLPGIILGVASIYLLVRELYGRIPALSAALLFATLPTSIGESLISFNKPAYVTSWLCILGFWLFVRAWRKEDRLSLIFPGILLGIASLAWEGALYFFPPVLLGAWLLEVLRGRASRRLNILTSVTLLMFGAIASLWYAPIFWTYGIWSHANTPAIMLADSPWTNAPTLFGGPVPNAVGYYVNSYSLIGDFGPLLFLGVLALPFILLKGKTEDSLGFVWLSFGALAPFLVGEKTLNYLTMFGLIVVLSWVLSKLPVSNGGRRPLVRRRIIKSGRDLHVYEASLVLLLVIGSGLYLGTQFALNPVGILLGGEDVYNIPPKGSVVFSWWDQGGNFEAFGDRVFLDLYLEHLPASMAHQDEFVGCIYLSNVTAAYAKLKALNVSYVYVAGGYFYPIATLVNACGLPGSPGDYYRPGSTLTLPAIEPPAKSLFLSLMLNESSSLSSHFKLVYSSDYPAIRLYQVLPP